MELTSDYGWLEHTEGEKVNKSDEKGDSTTIESHPS